MFQVNGSNGIYDNKIADPSVKYGRNAVENHIQYMEKPLIEGLNNPNPAPILEIKAQVDNKLIKNGTNTLSIAVIDRINYMLDSESINVERAEIIIGATSD